jgi:hypothetical protein
MLERVGARRSHFSSCDKADKWGAMEIFALAFTIQGIVIGCFSSWIARQKGRSKSLWFVLGFLFSFVALLALIAGSDLTSAKPNTFSRYNDVPDITKDDYRLFLVERSKIEHNTILNLYSNGVGKSFKTFQEAIDTADIDYKSELQAQLRNQEVTEEIRTAQLEREKKQLMFGTVFWAMFIVGCVLYWIKFSE